MNKTLIAMALLMVIGAPSAMAQGGNSGSSLTKGGGGDIPQAPIGHRQPRASDFQSEKGPSDPNNPVNKEDALLDKKIKSICRGC